MKIICPTLNRNEPATENAIAEIVPMLENRHDPFLILEKDLMTYMQTAWSKGGYELEYQEGTIFEHFWVPTLADKEEVIWALQSYLRDEPYWRTRFKFERKEIATTSYRLGHRLGYMVGRVFRTLRRQ